MPALINTRTSMSLQETHVEGLRRFSTSCPSLAEPEFVKIGIPVKPEPTSDISCHKSMLNLAEDDRSNNNPSPNAGSDTLTVPDMVKGGGHCAGERRHSHIGGCAVDVRIVISEVPTDESEDAASAPPQPPSAATLSLSSDPELLIEHIKKQQKRRSSWCPEKERKKEEKGEKQRMLLAVSGRRCKLLAFSLSLTASYSTKS
ncbi:hypothetical protein CAPTEDRAFT_209222 [Capitella teleta]|uniref:Uncharacterized protein n=1 Tax=Capitella teleta TaxID=283909 RepID=R7VMD8_CAPTE|nr:hypothetical protein CAPTEDRAFT_209222 [Capitella teleta]|eukprot:ELU18665.1 hypothetical protein CAPTEDRAFT_209222 [Capitella teleta]